MTRTGRPGDWGLDFCTQKLVRLDVAQPNRDAGGAQLQREMPDKKSIVLFALARGGSSIFGRVLQLLCSSAGFALQDIDADSYNRGVDLNDIPRHTFDTIPEHGALVGPFRALPRQFPLSKIRALRPVVLVRDPRDCLVSHYFAFKNLHTRFVPGQPPDLATAETDFCASIDEYVLDLAASYRSVLIDFRKMIEADDHCLVYKYEEIVAHPVAWLDKLSRDLHLQSTAAAMTQAVVEAAFTRVGESPAAHNRQGLAGNFVLKLATATAAQLTEEFGDLLCFFGYETDIAKIREQRLLAFHETNWQLRRELDEIKRAIGELQAENGYRIEEIASLRSQVEQLIQKKQTAD